jgi:hypothetical protein
MQRCTGIWRGGLFGDNLSHDKKASSKGERDRREFANFLSLMA